MNAGGGRTLGDRAIAPALAANAAMVLAFLYLPIAVLVGFSFSGSRYALVWGGFSFRWYAELANDLAIRRALANSLVIGAAAAGLSTVLGTLTALGLERLARRRSTAREDAAVTVPLLVPDLVQGVSLLMAFVVVFNAAERMFGVQPMLGRTTVVIAHTAYAMSYVTILVRARLAGMGRDLEEAALDLGATPWQAFRRVTLPLAWPGILGGALLAFTLSLDEFVITFFTGGPDATTLPVHVWSMVRRGVTPEINALSAALVLGSAALAAGAAMLQRRR